MKKLFLFFLLLFCIGWQYPDGWLENKALSHVIDYKQFSVNKTHVTNYSTSGDSVSFTIPGRSLLTQFVISADTPAATIHGTTVKFAIGSDAQSGATIYGGNITYMKYSTATNASQTYGLLTAQYDGQKFATANVMSQYYVSNDSTVYLNYLITGDAGAVATCNGRLYIIYDKLQ